jgi:hypothetical protein
MNLVFAIQGAKDKDAMDKLIKQVQGASRR